MTEKTKPMTDERSNHLQLLGIARYEDEHGDKEVSAVVAWAYDEIRRLREENERLTSELIKDSWRRGDADAADATTDMAEEVIALQEQNAKLRKFVADVNKAFESNKNFMWGHGLWSVVSKVKRALRELDKEHDE